jgi:hypothetical protein
MVPGLNQVNDGSGDIGHGLSSGFYLVNDGSCVGPVLAVQDAVVGSPPEQLLLPLVHRSKCPKTEESAEIRDG